MEYIEKAKYEIIMAYKNNESKEILDFLKEYYKDMVNVISNNYFNKANLRSKYILTYHNNDGTDEPYNFVFSNKTSLLNFCEKYKDVGCHTTVCEIHNIDPENPLNPNYEENFVNWKIKN